MCFAWFFLITGIIMLFLSVTLMGMTGMTGEVATFLLIAFVELAIALVAFLVAGKKKRQKEEDQRLQKLRQFYSECISAGALDMTRIQHREQAVAIATRLQVPGGGDIGALFRQCQQLFANDALREQADTKLAQLDTHRQEETELQQRLTRYAALRGREKPLAMLQDREDLTDTQKRLLKESLEMKLVSEMNPEELILWLKFTDVETRITDTGAVRVSVTVTCRPGLKIYQGIPAVMDGTLAARITQGGKILGSALLVLPFEGAAGEVRLEGICLTPCRQDLPCQVDFLPHNLWAMEQ